MHSLGTCSEDDFEKVSSTNENESLPKMGTFEINKDLNSQKDPYSS